MDSTRKETTSPSPRNTQFDQKLALTTASERE
jgi:hypothetical protein